MGKPWFEERPGILDRELNSFNEFKIHYEIDKTIQKEGVLCIKLTIDPKTTDIELKDYQENIELIIHYPELYPFFRPHIFGENLSLPRHQNPIGKNLCLLGRQTIEWDSRQTAAGLLKEQLPKLLEKGIITDADVIKNDPAEQGEPVSEYYATSENPVLFDPSVLEEADLRSCEPRLLASLTIGIGKEKIFPARLAVLETKLTASGQARQATFPLPEMFASKFDGQLYRVPTAPPPNAADTLNWLRKLVEGQGHKFKLPNNTFNIGPEILIKNVTGFCFEEEKQKGETGYAFLFHWEIIVKSKPEKGMVQIRKTIHQYVRALNPTPVTKNLRTPKLAPLAEKTVSIAGLGALGGFIAIELARSGIGKLKLLDHDAVEPATTIRWPLGLSAVGINKAAILKAFIEVNYPGTKVEVNACLLGNFPVNTVDNRIIYTRESEQVENFFTDTNLIIDATAEFGVHHFLSQETKIRDVSYISLFATPGAFGGSIMRQVPYRTGCWSCFTNMETDGTILKLNSDAVNGLIQPPGCGNITFTGASVDVQQVSLMATKLAISTLCGDTKDAYPSVDWDIARVNLFGENGEFLVPEWKTYGLPIHPNCHYCN